jgi:hypothetical protein
MANTLKFGNGQWATKVGSTLAYNDENGNFKPLPFNFTRSTSGTRVNKDGLIEMVTNNKPRIDFLNDSNGALLLEPTRSNLILNSEKLSLSPIKSGTFTNDFAISPDGTQNATKLTATNLDPYFYQPVSFAAASYTASIYIKGIGNSIGKDFRIVIGTNLSTDLIIPSEWTRFEYTATMSSGSANAGIEIPNPAIVGDEVLIWGWQVEQGSYATSYIPTQGATATRVAEVCIDAGNDQVINSAEGVLYAEISAFDNISRISLSDGSSSNRVSFRIDASSIDFQYRTGGSYSYRVDVNIDTSNTNKIAMSFNNGVFVGYLNGVAIGSPISGASLGQGVLDRLNFNDGDSSDSFNGNVKDVRIYNTALTDQELINLTTI